MLDQKTGFSHVWLYLEVLFSLLLCGMAAPLEDSSQESSGRSEFQQSALIVMSTTFSLGLVVGGLWCYCMSAVCKTRQCDQKHKVRLTIARREDYMRRHFPHSGSLSGSESPTLSTSSASTSSHIPHYRPDSID